MGEAIVRLTSLPIPGSIVGMFLLLILLLTGILHVQAVTYGAMFFLGQMLLFLIPATMVLMDHPELLGPTGLKILFVIFSSTAIVMLLSGWMTHLSFRLMTSRHDSPSNDN